MSIICALSFSSPIRIVRRNRFYEREAVAENSFLHPHPAAAGAHGHAQSRQGGLHSSARAGQAYRAARGADVLRLLRYWRAYGHDYDRGHWQERRVGQVRAKVTLLLAVPQGFEEGMESWRMLSDDADFR